jgi:hypothetical protein
MCKDHNRTPDFAPSSKTCDYALSLRLQEASADRPGGFVGQAVLEGVAIRGALPRLRGRGEQETS